jgi:predicted nucleotidyltransferase
MCSKNVLSEVTNNVVVAARNSLGEKLDKVILYGSYARGDYDDESDIDIMVLADIPHEDCWKESEKIIDLTWEFNLEHDVLVTAHVTDCKTFYEYIDVLPFYMNVAKEGVELYAA